MFFVRFMIRVKKSTNQNPKAYLRLRAELMDKFTALFQIKGSMQLEAAKHRGVTQPRINELLQGRISRFSLDAQINIAARLGQRVHVAPQAA